MTSEKYLTQLKVSFWVTLSFTMGIGLIAYYILKPSNPMGEVLSIYVMIGLFIGVFTFLVYLLLNKQKSQEAAQFKFLSDKLIFYKKSIKLINTILVSPAILNFLLFGLGGPIFNFYIGLFFLGILGTKYPTIQRLTRFLSLNQKETHLLESSNYKIF